MSNRSHLTAESFALTYRLPEPRQFLELGGAAELHARICAAAQSVTPGMHAVNAAYAQFIENCKTRAKPEGMSLKDYKSSLLTLSAHAVTKALRVLNAASIVGADGAFSTVDRALGGVLAARRADLLPELERELLVQDSCCVAKIVARNFSKADRRAVTDAVELYEESWPPSGDFPNHYSWISVFRRHLSISAA